MFGTSRYACSNQSLCSLPDYRASESLFAGSTDRNGNLYEHSVYELRLNPPNVEVDNTTYSDRTVLVVDSANRPGTLVEVVQCLTEMGLSIRKARVSSDGEWFVDEFIVDRVTDPKKLQAIKDVLSAGPAYLESQSDKNSEVTVFELAGTDTAGLLHDIVALLENNNCAVQSVALWTHNKRVAAVIAVTDKWRAVSADGGQLMPAVAPAGSHTDAVKSARLKQLLYQMLDSHRQGDAIVEVSTVRGPIHHERRLHQLLLKEEELNWSRSPLAAEYEQQMSNTGGRPSVSSPALSSSSLSDISSVSSDTNTPDTCQPSTPSPLPPPSPPRPTYSIVSGLPLTNTTKSHVGRSNLSRVTGADQQPCPVSAPTCNGGGGGSPRSRSSSSSGSGVRGSGAQASADGTSIGDLSSDVGSDLNACGSSCGGATPPTHTKDALKEAPHTPNNGTHTVTTATTETLMPPQLMSSSLSAITDLPGGAGMHAGTHTMGHTPPLGFSSLSLPDTSSMHPLSPPPRSAVLMARHSAGSAATKPPLASSRRACPASLMSAKACKPVVDISRDARRSYLVISISCKDRKKLFFDTLCTLADLDYDVYHASVDLESDVAHQEYYIRTRFGDSSWNVQKAARLKYMLEASIQRRHPRGVKVHIQSGHAYDLSALTGAWRQAGLWITRAKAEPYSVLTSKGSDTQGTRFANTFYILDRNGCAPDTSVLQRTCMSQGGKPLLQPSKHAKQAKQQQQQQQQQQEQLLQALPMTPAPVTVQCAPNPVTTHAPPTDAQLLQDMVAHASCAACPTQPCEHAVRAPLTASALQCANAQQAQLAQQAQREQQQLAGGSAECALMCADLAAQQQSLPIAATQSSPQECASFSSTCAGMAGAAAHIAHPHLQLQPQLPHAAAAAAEAEAAALGLPTLAGSVGEANGAVNGCSVGRSPCAVGRAVGGVGGSTAACVAGGNASLCTPAVCGGGEAGGVAITHGAPSHTVCRVSQNGGGAVPAAGCMGGVAEGHEPSFAFAVMQRSSRGSMDTASSVASSS